MLETGRSRVRFPMKSLIFFSSYLILPTALGPVVYSASNRNESQKQKKMYLGSRAWPAREAHNLTAICEREPQHLTNL
jgi:hypothetical protein